MWLYALAACDGDPSPQRTPDAGNPETKPPTEPPPLVPVPEIPCSGVDESGDGKAGSSERCLGAVPDVILASPVTGGCCLRWAVVPDGNGDGSDDALLELQYDHHAEATGATAWLMPATTSGQADLLAYASFTVEAWYADPLNPPVAGEFDGEPGIDLWVQRHLFTAPTGANTALDAVADAVDAPTVVDAADFDGDGIDDLLLKGSFVTGTYHSGGYNGWSEGYLAYGPFSASLGGLNLMSAQVGGRVQAFDADGSGAPEIAIDQTDDRRVGPVRLLRPDTSEVGRFDVSFYPVGDLDGDGFEDAYSVEEPEVPEYLTVYAGPFTGTFDPSNHPILSHWTVFVDGVPDLDGDGRGELVTNSLTDGLDVLQAGEGSLAAFDAIADSRFHTPAVRNTVPSGGPFVGRLGDDPEADLAMGIYDPKLGWNPAMYVFFEPLY